MNKLINLLIFLIIPLLGSCHIATNGKTLDKNRIVEVTLFFTDVVILHDSDCRATVPVTRKIQESSNLLDSTLRLLFEGVTDDEKSMNLSDSFGSKSANPLIHHYIGVRVEDRRAMVNFSEGAMVYLNSALCEQDSVKAPIEKTLLEFPDIDSVEYSIGGKIVKDFDA